MACFAQVSQGSFQVHDLWFLKKEKVSQDARFFMVNMWHLKSQQGTQKRASSEFLILLALQLASCGLVVFINMSTYILTEGINFKIFLKENYPITLESCKLHIYWKNVEHGIEHDVDSSYGDCIY